MAQQITASETGAVEHGSTETAPLSVKNPISSWDGHTNESTVGPPEQEVAETDSIERHEETRCEECGGHVVDDDGERYCSRCGLVEDCLDLDRQQRRGRVERNHLDARRCGGTPRTVTRHDRGMATEIGYSGSSQLSRRKRRQLYRFRQHQSQSRFDSNDYRRAAALTEIKRLTSALGLPRSIMKRACVLFREAHEADLLQGRTSEWFASASVYAACRGANLVRTADEIANYARCSASNIQLAYRTMNNELGLGADPVSPREFIPRFASQLDVSYEVRLRAEDIAERAHELGEDVGRSPSGFAGSCLYLAATECGAALTQAATAEVASVTEVTIRAGRDHLEELDLDAVDSEQVGGQTSTAEPLSNDATAETTKAEAGETEATNERASVTQRDSPPTAESDSDATDHRMTGNSGSTRGEAMAGQREQLRNDRLCLWNRYRNSMRDQRRQPQIHIGGTPMRQVTDSMSEDSIDERHSQQSLTVHAESSESDAQRSETNGSMSPATESESSSQSQPNAEQDSTNEDDEATEDDERDLRVKLSKQLNRSHEDKPDSFLYSVYLREVLSQTDTNIEPGDYVEVDFDDGRDPATSTAGEELSRHDEEFDPVIFIGKIPEEDDPAMAPNARKVQDDRSGVPLSIPPKFVTGPHSLGIRERDYSSQQNALLLVPIVMEDALMLIPDGYEDGTPYPLPPAPTREESQTPSVDTLEAGTYIGETAIRAEIARDLSMHFDITPDEIADALRIVEQHIESADIAQSEYLREEYPPLSPPEDTESALGPESPRAYFIDETTWTDVIIPEISDELDPEQVATLKQVLPRVHSRQAKQFVYDTGSNEHRRFDRECSAIVLRNEDS